MADVVERLPIETLCMACDSGLCDFKPKVLQRRAVDDHDVLIDMKYCGVCHTDLHTAVGHLTAMGAVNYPCVPGHELAGVCAQIGSKVTKVKVGDQIGVGCMVDSCMKCGSCLSGEEQKCMKQVATYNAKDNGSGRAYSPLGYTIGGYTTKMVVHEDFAIHIPQGYPLEYAGPVMCAGVTMYDPMVKQQIQAGDHLGIVGLGGLGQMGVKIGKALGCHVSVVTRSRGKEEFAKECGADMVIISTDAEQMQAQARTLDLILNTVPVYHDYCAYNKLLKKKGRQVLLGLHNGIVAAMAVSGVTCGSSRVISSGIGGIRATQDVINLCAERKIFPTIKTVPVSELNNVYTQLDNANNDGLRYVLDIAGTLNDAAIGTCINPPPTISPTAGFSWGGVVREACWLFCTCNWC
eukprot:TRINITY_DN4503_c0_g1_i1.p1 TRINITY_DN4503_c0_g1~~TRINITY_DN4503_c0_g1_i1.p1  ORF type:complete len:407 (-),score=40.68 TRINITY_DN4503_c0_g1_i1:269-1489(-)